MEISGCAETRSKNLVLTQNMSFNNVLASLTRAITPPLLVQPEDYDGPSSLPSQTSMIHTNLVGKKVSNIGGSSLSFDQTVSCPYNIERKSHF
jgi:hypothetical protein